MSLLIGILRVKFSLWELLVNVVGVDQRLHDELPFVSDDRHGSPGLLQEPLRLALKIDVDNIKRDVFSQESQNCPLGVRAESNQARETSFKDNNSI